ncbi:IS3 family transposase [Dubosiella newyorkensis]|uniref:IS3 family transposase n=1 Tax=Dubosiella newyorkensis TaxID=1862672 RepID=UPI003F66464F
MDQLLSFPTMKEAKKAVFEYIEGFYNTIRIHSHCGYESPMEYENNYKILKKMRFRKKLRSVIDDGDP